MRCVASGKPFPFIRWYKDGYMVNRKGKKKFFYFLFLLYKPCRPFQYGKGELKFSSLTFDDSGMYQCVAENYWGIKYANAQLQVIGKSVRFKTFRKCEITLKPYLCSARLLQSLTTSRKQLPQWNYRICPKIPALFINVFGSWNCSELISFEVAWVVRG